MPFIESSLGLVRWKGRTGQLGSSRGRAEGEPGRTPEPGQGAATRGEACSQPVGARSARAPPRIPRAVRRAIRPAGPHRQGGQLPAPDRRSPTHRRPAAARSRSPRTKAGAAPGCRPLSAGAAAARPPPGRARGRDVGLPQHPPGRHRTAAVPDPACQHDGMTDDRAFPRPACRVAKTFHGVHRGTLLPTWEGRDPPALNMINSHRVCYLCCRRPIDAFSVNFHLAGAPCDV